MNPVKRNLATALAIATIFSLGNLAIALAIAMIFSIGAARADDATSLQTESRSLERNAAVTGETHAGARISQDFASFAGSGANASNLVTGLRHGTLITLTAPSGTNQAPSSVSFTPPTRPMGNGNVYISLALAKQQLASLGITQPTPEQIKAALVGGTVTTGSGATARTVTLPGVLTQRSQGMGWGNIAKSQGVTLGSVVSGMKRANHDLSAIHTHQEGAARAVATSASGATTLPVSTGAGTERGHGIVTAAGGAGASHANQSRGNIVTGMGAVRGDGPSAAAGARGEARGHVR